MARFTSQYRSLTLQGDGDEQPYAVFADGVFETDDDAVADRLRAVSDGSVVEEVVQDDAEDGAEDGEAPSPTRRRARRGVPAVDGASESSPGSSQPAASGTPGDEA